MDLIPHLLRVTPSRPSLPSHLGLLGQKDIGGLCCWGCFGEGECCVCSTPSSALDLPSLFPTDAMEEDEGALKRNHQIPSLVTHSSCWGTGKGPRAGSPVLQSWQRAGMAQGHGQRRVAPRAGQQGRAARLHRIAALLPVTEKSLRQQILLSVKMPLTRGSSCPQNQGRAAGFEKILSLTTPGVSTETCPGIASPATAPLPRSCPEPQTPHQGEIVMASLQCPCHSTPAPA